MAHAKQIVADLTVVLNGLIHGIIPSPYKNRHTVITNHKMTNIIRIYL